MSSLRCRGPWWQVPVAFSVIAALAFLAGCVPQPSAPPSVTSPQPDAASPDAEPIVPSESEEAEPSLPPLPMEPAVPESVEEAPAPATLPEEPAMEEPKVEEPKAEEPKAEEPKMDEPKAEEPKVEEPKAEEPKAEEPKMDEPKAEEPKVEEPKAEEPKMDEPKMDEPKVEEPKVEEPKAEEPKVEEPKAEEPKAEEPKMDEPKAEEPKMDESKAEEPKVEEPKAEEPKAEEPKMEEPKVEEPKVEEPKAEEPKMEEPKVEESAKSQAADGEPVDYIKVPTPAWMPEPVEVENATAASQEEMKAYTEVIPDTTVTFGMVPIPGGKFTLGSPDTEEGRKDDEGPRIEVELEPFWMGKHEVTWDEYELWGLGLDKQRREMTNVARTDRHELVDAVAIPTKPYTDMTFGMGKDGYPAICMTQTAAKMYCKWLSAKTGRYYRLPTEAEWEYACRAGSKSAFAFGDDPEKLGDYAWYYDNSNEKYQKVGQKKANEWGLHDIHGNVAEWVLDQHTPDFYATLKDKPSPVKNPLAEATKLYPRVVRGGSWDDDAKDVRSAARRGSTTDWMMQDPQIPQSPWYHTDADFVGFRVIRPLRVPTAEEAKRYELDEVQITELEEYREAQAGKM